MPSIEKRMRSQLSFRQSVRHSAEGFTLVELVIVTALFSLLTLIVYSTLNLLTQGKKNIEAQVSSERMSRYLIQRITRELMSYVELNVIVRDENGNPEKLAQPPLIYGKNSTVGDSDRDSLQFVSANSGQSGFGAGNYGNVQLTYRVVPTPGAPESDPPVLTLIREESPANTTDPAVYKSTLVSIALARNLTGLNFRYLKNAKWKDDQFGTTVPDAIEITLKLLDESGRVQVTKTAIALRHR